MSSPPLILLVCASLVLSGVLLAHQGSFAMAVDYESATREHDGNDPTGIDNGTTANVPLSSSQSFVADTSSMIRKKQSPKGEPDSDKMQAGGLEEREQQVAIASMSIAERADAAERFYEEFKQAVEELSQVDATDFPELEELLQESFAGVEAMSEPLTDAIHFLRLAAAEADGDGVRDEDSMLDENMLPPLLKGNMSFLSEQGDETPSRRLVGATAARRGNRKEANTRNTKPRRGLHRNSDNSNSFAGIRGGLGSGGDHRKLVKKFIQALQPHSTRHDDTRFPSHNKNYNEGIDASGHGRRLKTKNEKCEQLAECASHMSLYDLFVLFHSDDIDPVTGAVDANVVLFDEVNIVAKKGRIQSMAQDILQDGSFTMCDSLLEEFHRTVEFDGIPQWEGSTISQVCLAEGTTVYVDFASLYEALVPESFPEEEVLEKLLEDMNRAIHQYMSGGGTTDQFESIRKAKIALLEALSLPRRKEAFNVINLFVQETFACAEELFDSNDRTGDPSFENESSLFAPISVGATTTLTQISPLHGVTGQTAFNDLNSLGSDNISKIVSITVHASGPNIFGLETTYLTRNNELQTLSHGSTAGDATTVNFGDDVLQEVYIRYLVNSHLVQIRFRDSKGAVYGPFGQADGPLNTDFFEEATLGGDAESAIIAFYGFESRFSTDFMVGLGVYFEDGVAFEYYSQPTVQYQIPNGLSMAGGSRTSHGQIRGGDVSPFTFTSTIALLEEYGSCLDTVVSPIKGLFEVFNRVDDLPNLQNGAGFAPCENDPESPYFICRELNAVGLLPIEEDPSPFLCGSNGWVSYDGSFCCAADVCGVGACGSHCPSNSNSIFGSFLQKIERAKCCEDDIRRNSFECTDPTHVGCNIKEGDRWYDIAFRKAMEQFLEETEGDKTCASDYLEKIQYGLGLVFGERRSTPGYVCGIKSAVVDEGKSLPGTCCLDAPYELGGGDWGFNYECSMTCQNLAPYFSGMSEESCDVYGGTWCPQPTDCSILQTCIANFLMTAQSESRLQAFAMYLSAAPRITDPTNSDQCGETREYFGFDPDFINDVQICDDIEQLRFSRDFTFLEEFLGEGEGSMTPPGDSPGLPEPPGVPVDGEPEDVPPLELTPPDRSATESTPVQNGQAWRATNFVLEQKTILVFHLLRVLIGFECFLDFKFIKANICIVLHNALVGKQNIVVKKAKQILEISKFTYGELAEIDNVGELAILENSDAIFGNMELMATYLQERFMDLNWYIESETDTIKEILNGQNPFLMTSLDAQSDFLAGVTRFENAQVAGMLQLLLNHFNITFENRRLHDSRPTEISDTDHQQNTERGSNPHILSGDIKKDRAQIDNDCFGHLHKVQIEIMSSTNPRSFVCGVVRHKDANVLPNVLELEKLDVVTNNRVPVTGYDVVDLGRGALLVSIPNVDEDKSLINPNKNVIFFVTVGLADAGSEEIVAEHSLIVSFP
mmetsp:Transcript_84099/g.126082  ORF Transcript_84099/g.126082 Transcript_84099/m.126082 type:complete len:1454 (+) Transcript_84099:272-4633(+)|eukprot:CAMPEP_0117024102 /NCGR_PEP_ID=MMETSP0472-20121206/17928_1 /TAXON_ID=693140 ORGANISM="Tiarina fusus, Strain LIS" /NCGR_SAMPLE_ID=MMETSP0472 /ASSEMBLY_ACC=CAM_ASM_000603 /LENGTH=1453 /DNA_ID=CAMNT_0004730427 /DNA_START=266 /DNA_END=4627 /DNA_ORIENTATION=-